MKILNISSSGGIGGREMQVLTLSEGLRSKDCDVRLIVKPGTWLEKEARKQKIPIYSLRMQKYVDLVSIFRIGKILREFKPEIVHIYFISDIWLVVPAVKLFSPKTKIFLLRCMQSVSMKDFLRTKLFNALNKVMAVSDFIKNDFLEQTKLKKEKIETVYIGTNLNKFDCVKTENVLKKDYDLDKDSLLIGIVGRIDDGKGQEDFVIAAKKTLDSLEEKKPEFLQKIKFFIVGSSEKGSGINYEMYLKSLTLKFGVEQYFVFTGFRSDIAQVMKSLDIAVFPSKKEAFGLVVIEAMASGTATIVYNTGAFLEIITDGENGIVKPNNPHDLADGILELIFDENKRKKICESGRKTVEEKFSLELTLKRFLEIYNE